VVVVPPDCNPGPVVVVDKPLVDGAVVVVEVVLAAPDLPGAVVEEPVGPVVETDPEVEVVLGRVVAVVVVVGGTVVVVVVGAAGGTVVWVTAVFSGG
jgi:hypothetical protein